MTIGESCRAMEQVTGRAQLVGHVAARLGLA